MEVMTRQNKGSDFGKRAPPDAEASLGYLVSIHQVNF